jgi:hypothetical protein
MRISHLSNEKKPKYIEVRNYDNNAIVNFRTKELSENRDNVIGVWNVTEIYLLIPKEYNYLNENITFLPQAK